MIEHTFRKQKFKEFMLPEGKTVASFARSLRAIDGIRRAPSEKFDCTFYDSFDGRAYADNILLAWIDRGDSGVLQAMSTKDTVLLWEQPMAKSPPGFGWTIDQPARAKWLKKCMGLRALLPMIRLSVKRQTFRWTDDEDKTRAWIYIESIRISNGRGPAPVSNRVVVRPVRGYLRSVQKLEYRMIREAGARIDKQGLYSRLMETYSARFARRTSKLKVPLDPDMDTRAAIVEVLSFLADVMEINEEGVMAAWDTEFLHDFRVSIRRTRALLGQLKKQFSAEEIQPFRDEFAWLGQATGPLRDIDVYLMEIPEFQKMLPSDFQDYLEPVSELLLSQQKVEHGKLKTVLRGKRYRNLMNRWREFLLLSLPKMGQPEAGLEGTIRVLKVAQKRIQSCYKRVLKEGWAIDGESPAEDLHELRKTCKKLRYMIECFQCLFPSDQIGSIIREMKQLQENLGEFQDLDVQIDGLIGFAEELDIGNKTTPHTLLAMGAVLGNLEHRKREVRTEFNGRFAQFSSGENRKRFNSLFKGSGQQVQP
jgi:CHAD domain-containing protein